MLATAIAWALIFGLALAVSLVWARALTPRPHRKIRERARAASGAMRVRGGAAPLQPSRA